MKTKNIFIGLALVVLLFSGSVVCAAEKPAVTEMAAMKQFLDLSDAELAQLQEVIARLRAMTPAQRSALQAELARFRQLPAGQREQLRQGWGGMSPALQDGWREMMQAATPERREEIKQTLAAKEPGEKTAYRRQLVEDFLKAKASQPLAK